MRFTEPATGYDGFTTANAGTDDAADSDANTTTGTTGTYTLAAGDRNLTADAGLLKPVDLVVDKEQAGTFVTGSGVTYTITVRNDGPGVEKGPIAVVDHLPAGVTFVSVAGTGWDCNHAAGVVTCTTAGPLAKGATLPPISIKATVAAAPGTPITNEVDVTGESRDINLTNNHDEVTANTPVASLGDTVWNDIDRDGTQDAGEPGIAGVKVELLNAAGTVVRTTTTDANGKYLFSGLVPGTYSVRFTAPADFEGFTAANAGTDDAVDSDAVVASAGANTATTAAVELSPGENDLTVDAGLLAPVDLVVDKEQAGTFTTGTNATYTITVRNDGPGTEPGPITVVDQLPTTVTYVSASGTGWTCAAATPDAHGTAVTCSRPGPVAKGTTLPTITITATVTAPPDTAVRNEVDVTGTARDVNLTNNHDEVVANTPVATIGDYVWDDIDRDGVQDDGEPGVAGVKVELVTAAGTVVRTTTTDADGKYLFDFVIPSTYTVRFTLPAEFEAFTSANAGTNDATDSDVDSDGVTGSYTLTGGTTNLTADAGLVRPVDLVVDKNQSGTFVTGSEATYTIDVTNAGPGTEPGPIKVVDTLPSGVTFVSATGTGWTCDHAAGTGSTPSVVTCSTPGPLAKGAALPRITIIGKVTAAPTTVVKNVVDVTGVAKDVTLTNNHDEVSVTVPKASIGDFVFDDVDGDGTQDSGEPGISGVKVELLNAAGAVVATTTTDSNGKYLFDNLVPGTYSVRFTTPSGLEPTKANQGDDATDSDVSVVADTGYVATGSYTLAIGQSNLTADAGFVRPVDLGVDKDIVAGTKVATGSNISFTLDVVNNGPGQEPGPITVIDTLPAGLKFVSAAGTGWTCSHDGSADGGLVTCTLPGPLASGAKAARITVTALVTAAPNTSLVNKVSVKGVRRDTNAPNNTDEVPFTPGKAAIGDFVWNDIDRDGTQDPLEPGIGEVTVELIDANGKVVATTTTDATGQYRFDNVVPGTYTVRFVGKDGYVLTTKGAGSDRAIDSNAGSDGRTDAFTVGVGEQDLTIDAGYYLPIDLAIDKTLVSGNAAAGTELTYSLAVTNHGPAAEVGPVVVTDTLPAQLTFVSAAGTGWTCSAAGQVVTCATAGGLAAGVNASPITVVARVATGLAGNTEIVNVASVRGAQPVERETRTDNNTDTERTRTPQPPVFTGSFTERTALVGAMSICIGLLLAATMRRRRNGPGALIH